MTLGELTIVIFRCNSLEELRTAEDYALDLGSYKKEEMTCVYQMLTVRNKILVDSKVERKTIYKF